MATKCVHKGCGKVFTDLEEPCHYHPGPPEFHEGQKGWKCCKPRVLTFDEFMDIPPCTVGKHSTVDDTPIPESKANDEEVEAKIREQNARAAAAAAQQPAVARTAVTAQPPRATPSPAPPPEDEDDDPDLPIPDGATCRRRGCGGTYRAAAASREGEECVHHPGQALFHEGSKGWTCCKKRVLEFDEFMKIPGCKSKDRHCFVGRKKEDASKEEELNDVRSDFYQTATTVIASLYLKKIDKERSNVAFAENGTTVDLDLHTSDNKHFCSSMQFFGPIRPADSSFKVMGTKLELTLAKADGQGWPVLRATDPHTGEIIQAGRAGKV